MERSRPQCLGSLSGKRSPQIDGRRLWGGELIDCCRTSGDLCSNTGANVHTTDYQGLDLLALIPGSAVDFPSGTFSCGVEARKKTLNPGRRRFKQTLKQQ